MMQVLTDVQALELKRKTMIEYLRMKLDEADWHAVCDAGMDLREIEVLLDYHRTQERMIKNAKEELGIGMDSRVAAGQSGGQMYQSNKASDFGYK